MKELQPEMAKQKKQTHGGCIKSSMREEAGGAGVSYEDELDSLQGH